MANVSRVSANSACSAVYVVVQRCHNPRMNRVRLAVTLWIVWAVVVWNVVFDRVLVVAGRQYVDAATLAARAGGPFARVEDWMRPAVVRGFWMATTAAASV